MRKSYKATNIAISLGLLVALAGCDAGSEKLARPLDRFVKPVQWAACEGKDAPKAPFECATVTAPLDYKNVKGDTIDIAMIRLPATEGKSKGVVLMNPGGPGESGFGFLASYGESLAYRLEIQEFDFVSFDPRGVDRSGGLRCHTDKELDQSLMVDPTPDTKEEEKALEFFYKLGDPCEKKFGDTLKFFSTENTARDMDLMRESMGSKKINYLGYSYGTYLGGVYATLFPNNVESMLLDSAFDPVGDTPEESLFTQPIGFEDSYNRFAEWCNDNSDCKFTTSDFNADWLALEKELDENSIVTKSGRYVNAATLDTATKQAFYSDDSIRPVLAEALQDARNGDGVALLKLADEYNGRDEKGHYSTSTDSFEIIQCASGIADKGVKNPGSTLKVAKRKAPWYFRLADKYWFESAYCGNKYDNPKPIAINYSGSAPIVIIGGDKDPATPFRWAEKMSKNIQGSVLVKYTGEGHSSVGINFCTTKVAANVIAKKELPDPGKECGVDVPLPEPTWWASYTKSLPGVEFPSSEFGDFFGFPTAGYFSELHLVKGGLTDARRGLLKIFSSRGLVVENPEVTGEDETIWFVNPSRTNEFIGARFFDEQVLALNELNGPEGPFAAGSTLVVIYTYIEE